MNDPDLGPIRDRLDRHPVAGDPAERRTAFDNLSPGTDAPQVDIGPLRGRVFGDGTPVLWLHGGGYVFGSSASHAACAAHLADAAMMCVIVPDFRLAPDHPWPAAREDIESVMDHLGGHIHIVGDSAGGNLALALARRHPGRIGRLALISPNTDRTGLSETRERNSPRDLMNDDAEDTELSRLAFGDFDAADPDLSPAGADLSMLPPTFLTASTHEVLLDDALMLARRLALADVEVELHVRRALPHMWTLWPDDLPEARDTLDRVARFLCSA
jgi:acetyl esterase/lipase